MWTLTACRTFSQELVSFLTAALTNPFHRGGGGRKQVPHFLSSPAAHFLVSCFLLGAAGREENGIMVDQWWTLWRLRKKNCGRQERNPPLIRKKWKRLRDGWILDPFTAIRLYLLPHSFFPRHCCLFRFLRARAKKGKERSAPSVWIIGEKKSGSDQAYEREEPLDC